MRVSLTLQVPGRNDAGGTGSRGSRVLAFVLLAFGGGVGSVGYARYRAAGIAIRSGMLPTPGRGPKLLTHGILTIALTLMMTYAITTRW